jgi:hypothetical protein
VTAGCERLALRALAVIALVAGAAHAQAPNQAAADQAFKQGRDLYKAEKYAEACEQFDRSYKLDPANGTLYNLAQCSERIGKLATAAAAYRELVAKDANEQRKASSAERLQAIAPRVPKLLVKVASPPPGIVVEIGSKAGPRGIAANQPIEVDAGEYTVIARARGYNEFMSRVKIQDGKTVTVEATLSPGASNTETVLGVTRTDAPKPARSHRKLFGAIAMATGGATLAGGIVVGVLARSAWDDAKAVCGGTTCTTQPDLDRANQLGDEARSKATLSTVLTLSGAAVAGIGAYLFFTAPGDTVVTPTASETGAGVTLSGAF